jgi:signal transduction histidine kinase
VRPGRHRRRSISIVARRDERRACVEVSDDGPGFGAAVIPHGRGPALIRDRLGLLYGNDALLSVTSQRGQTTVAISVPASHV